MGSRKLAVEECLALDVNDLARSGAFQIREGIPCNCVWTDDSSGREVFKVDFWLEGNAAGQCLRLKYKPDSSMPVPISCRIELESVPCHLGGAKHIFKCTGKTDSNSCGRRAQKMYLVEGRWVCRVCGDLTYLARRQHDKRKGALIRDPTALALALESADLRQRFLGIGAFTQAVARLNKCPSKIG